MGITSKDIAEKLGLSQPTVSRVLSNARGYRVSSETRRRVVEAAREMGYRPNAVARSLRHKRTNIVGFYTGYGYLNAQNAYMAAVLGGLQRACDAERFDILLHGVFHGRSTDDIYGELVDGRIDGLFLHTDASDPLVAQLANSALPVVVISDAITALPSVVADDAGGMRQMIDYLWQRGHRQIAFLAPQPKFSSVERRVAAFKAEMAQHGVADAPVHRIDLEESGAALDALRCGPHPPTAVCCWNDLSAANLLWECRVRGIHAPGELAVAGFDGVLNSRIMAQSLTTVSIPWDELGQRALEVLRARIAGKNVPDETCIPVQIAPGGTA